MATKKIKMGFSSCLLGEKVRFDGGQKWDHFLIDTLGPYWEFFPIRPEVEFGFGGE
jgi:uncharacterized protein YbbK (DUF523 family)